MALWPDAIGDVGKCRAAVGVQRRRPPHVAQSDMQGQGTKGLFKIAPTPLTSRNITYKLQLLSLDFRAVPWLKEYAVV